MWRVSERDGVRESWAPGTTKNKIVSISYLALADPFRPSPLLARRRLVQGGAILLQRVEQPGRRRARAPDRQGDIWIFLFFDFLLFGGNLCANFKCFSIALLYLKVFVFLAFAEYILHIPHIISAHCKLDIDCNSEFLQDEPLFRKWEAIPHLEILSAKFCWKMYSFLYIFRNKCAQIKCKLESSTFKRHLYNFNNDLRKFLMPVLLNPYPLHHSQPLCQIIETPC